MIYMLTPQNKKKKRQSRASNWTLYLSIAIIIALMLFAWMQEKSTAEINDDQHALADFSQLWQWSDQVLEQGAKGGEWSFRWDAALNKAELDTLSTQLFTNAKGEPMPKSIRKNGLVVDGAGILDGSFIQVHLTPSDSTEFTTTVLLQIEKGNDHKYESLKRYLRQIQGLVVEHDPTTTISMKVYGDAINDNSLKAVQQASLGQVVEQYEDNGTYSSTLYTNLLRSFVWLNGEKMANLQLSQHRSSEDQKMSITIGTPLISGEFGESVHKHTTN